MTPRNNLKGKNVLLTGATGGLGAELARKFKEGGCNVFVVGRNPEKLTKLKEGLGIIHSYSSDFTDGYPSALIGAVRDVFPEGVDVLINCAGSFFVKPLEETTLEDYRFCMEVNLNIPYFLCKEFASDMKERQWGRIINVASSSAYGAAPKTSAYSAAKHGLLGLSRALHNELKNQGVRVICVSPGSIQTPMGREVEKLGQRYDTFLDPAEIAEYIFYNASLDGEMIAEEIRLNRINIQ